MNEFKKITKVDKNLLDKIEHILASELSCEEYDMFYNYFNEIRKPNILVDIKDDENIKELITNLQSKIDKAIEYINKHCVNEKISKEAGYKCYTMADTNELEKIMSILGGDK